MELRPYQADLVSRVEDSTAQSSLVVLTTGGGKTAIAEALTARETARGGRVVFLADRQELIRQAHDRIGGTVIMGSLGRHNSPSAVTIASVATLARRSDAPDATLVFADEAHLYAAESFRRVLGAYRDSGARVVGLTATPARLDGQGLGMLFDEVIQGPPAEDLIRDGWLVPVDHRAPTGEWWDAVKLSGGDFDTTSLEAASSAVLRDVAARWLELGGAERPTLVFAVNKQHARKLAAEFDAHLFLRGLPVSETVTDDTLTPVRRSVRDRIQSGDLRVVITVGVLGTGFDAPAVSCNVMARPTLSWALYLQQGGRGLRTAQGKRDLLLIDCAGNSLRHGLLTRPFSVSLDGVRRLHRRAVAGLTTCRKCFRIYEWTEPQCPGCGAARPRGAVRRVQEVDGQLVELTGAQQWAERTTTDQQVRKLAAWIRDGAARGWKPGAPMARFKGTFHRWPSRQEIEEAKRLAGVAA